MFLCCRFLLTRAKISQKKEMKMHYQGKVQIFGISGNPALFTPFLRLFSRNPEVFVRISKKVREIPRIFAFLHLFSRDFGMTSGQRMSFLQKKDGQQTSSVSHLIYKSQEKSLLRSFFLLHITTCLNHVNYIVA